MIHIKVVSIDHGTRTRLGEHEIAVDVGDPTTGTERCFDHHSAGGVHHSATEAVHQRRGELVALGGTGTLTIYCHRNPDMDAVAGSFLAVSEVTGRRISAEDLQTLVGVVNAVDSGKLKPLPLLPGFGGGDNHQLLNFYSFFLVMDDVLRDAPELAVSAAQGLEEEMGISLEMDEYPGWRAMALGWALITQLLETGTLEEVLFSGPDGCGPLPPLRNDVWGHTQGKVATTVQEACTEAALHLLTGRESFLHALHHDADSALRVLSVKLPSKTGVLRAVPRKGLWIRATWEVLPFIKTLRGMCCPLIEQLTQEPITVLAFEPVTEVRRIIISMDRMQAERKGLSLQGLGLALEEEARKQLGATCIKRCRFKRTDSAGQERDDPLFPYLDPWYDGRHTDFTIVDAPSARNLRFLTSEKILEVLEGDWWKLAGKYRQGPWAQWNLLGP